MISFPDGIYQPTGSEDFNPSIRKFGRRFSDDQQVMDLVAEFLLVIGARKCACDQSFESAFPSHDLLTNWRQVKSALKYYPRLRLNLKLFSFLSSSRLDTRHATHREHALELMKQLEDRVALDTQEEKTQLFQTLSNLTLGFWGNGAQRTWCAQTFYPFCRGVLCGEVIWNKTAARRQKPLSWDEVLKEFSTYFDVSKHNFFARGGEALYLQLCNVFAQTKEEIRDWCHESGLDGFTDDELDPAKLRNDLEDGIKNFFDSTPPALERFLNFIDEGVDSETKRRSDLDHQGEPRSVTCGWIPKESWHEGFLFAVELKRLFAARLSPMETVDLLQVSCSLQVMRSLAAQTYRDSLTEGGRRDGLDYRVLICDPLENKARTRIFSWRSLAEISREIQQVIRTPEMQQSVANYCATKDGMRSKPEKIYKDADKYGFKLYRKIGKSIGLIVPPTGKYMRYTFNERILRYLVIALLPGARMTLESFKRQMKLHHGFVFDLAELGESRNWCNRIGELQGGENTNSYLERMLEASGTLVHLSDSCSLVKNPSAASAL